MTHLHEDQLAAVVADLEVDESVTEHLGHCLPCRQTVRDFREMVGHRLMDLAGEAPDWEAQRDAVLARLPQPGGVAAARRRRRWTRPLLAAAAVVVTAIGIAVVGSRQDDLPAGSGELQVEQILAEADALLADDTIPGFGALEPDFDDLEAYVEHLDERSSSEAS